MLLDIAFNKKQKQKGGKGFFLNFYLFYFFFIFHLCTTCIVHNLLENVAVAGTDEPGWIEVDCEFGIHRACLTATPVVANGTYPWNENREVFVAIVLGLKHAVAEPR